jgi:hypothetical protein
VDFEKAFDKVRRDGLWCKLLLDNINGKMYKVILSVVSKLPFLYMDYPEKPLELKTIMLLQTTTSSASDTDWKELPRNIECQTLEQTKKHKHDFIKFKHKFRKESF